MERGNYMKYEDWLFEIYYSEVDEKYMDKLRNTILSRMPDILQFFKIKFESKIVIKLYDDINSYKENLVASFEKNAIEDSKKHGKKVEARKYEDFMIANTEDGNLNMQSLSLVRMQEDYRNYTEDEFCLNACHEFTHLCQMQVGSENPGWFWEVIASTIGNPECQHEIKGSFTYKDLNENFDKIDGYGAAYTVGKYLFANYSQDFILNMIKDNEVFNKNIEDIVEKSQSTKNDMHGKCY